MTVICALTDGKRTWIGSDRRTSFGREFIDTTDKWTRCGPWWVGGSGQSRITVLVRRNTGRIAKHRNIDSLAEHIRAIVHGDHWQPKDGKGEPPSYDGSMIVARKGAVWLLDDSFTPYLWPVHRVLACGSGTDLAIGAGYGVLANAQIDLRKTGEGERVIWTCVTAACLNNIYCGGEPFVMKLDNPR